MKFVPYMIFIEKCTHCFSFTCTLNVWNTKVVQHFTTLLNHKQHINQFTFQLNNVFIKTPGQKMAAILQSNVSRSCISYKTTSLWSAVKFLRRIFCTFCLAPLGMPLEGYCKAARFFITCCLRSGGSPSTTMTGVMFS